MNLKYTRDNLLSIKRYKSLKLSGAIRGDISYWKTIQIKLKTTKQKQPKIYWEKLLEISPGKTNLSVLWSTKNLPHNEEHMFWRNCPFQEQQHPTMLPSLSSLAIFYHVFATFDFWHCWLGPLFKTLSCIPIFHFPLILPSSFTAFSS